jgi:hypothetical protein
MKYGRLKTGDPVGPEDRVSGCESALAMDLNRFRGSAFKGSRFLNCSRMRMKPVWLKTSLSENDIDKINL